MTKETVSSVKGKSGRKAIPITEHDMKQIKCLAGLGVPLDHMAVILEISPRTLDRWLKLPDIMVLYKKGLVRAEIVIAKTLFDLAMSGCVPAIIWWEKSRYGKSERARVKHSVRLIIY